MSSLPPSESVTSAPTPAAIISLHRLRVEDRERGDVFEAGVEDRAEHRHRVHRAAGGAVVAVVEQHDRAAAGRLGVGERAGARDRCGERLELVDERRARLPRPGRAARRASAAPAPGRRRSRPPPTGPANSMSAFGKPTKTLAQSAPSASIAAAARLQLAVRRVVGALAHHVRQHRPAAPGHRRARLAREQARAAARPARSPVSCMSTCG